MQKPTAVLLLLAWIPFGWQATWGQAPGVGKQSGHESKEQPTSSADKSNTDQRGTKNAPLVVDIKRHQDTPQEPAEAQSQKDHTSFVDRWTLRLAGANAIFTFVLMLAGVGGIILANLTLRTIQTQTNILAKEFELSHRPWVAVDLDVVSPLVADVNGLKVTIRFTLRNTGNSPAVKVWIDAVMDANWDERQVETNWKSSCARPNSPLGKRLGFTLFPGDSKPRDEPFIVTRKMIESNLDPEERRFLNLTIMGRVGYEFSFSDGQHKSPFIYQLREIEPASTGVTLPRERPIEYRPDVSVPFVELRPYYSASPDVPENKQAT